MVFGTEADNCKIPDEMTLRSVAPTGALMAFLLLLPVKSPPSARPRAESPAPRYGIPRLTPGQVWISSVPVGLEVHSGDNPFPKKVLGRTPLILNTRDLARSVTVTCQKKEFGRKLPDQMTLLDFSARLNHSNVWKGQNDKGEEIEEDQSRGLTYDIRAPEKRTIIALFQTKEDTPSDLERLYPPGSNFRFSDQALRKRLAQRGVAPSFISAGMRLLHRGGKIAFPVAKGSPGPVIAEVISSDHVELLDPPQSPAK